MNYGSHFSTLQTPQSEAIPGKSMVKNNAGGFAFAIDDWKRLERFLILGSEGGTYYVGEHELTVDNAQCVVRCAQADSKRTVDTIVSISEGGRAPKNDPAIFALALVAKFGDKKLAFEVLLKVCRIPTHLFNFVECITGQRGWGRSLRRAVANWYLTPEVNDLAYHAVKYQQRDGWANRDLLCLSHPKTDGARNVLFRWMVKGDTTQISDFDELRPVEGFLQLIKSTDAKSAAKLIREYNLPRECVPTNLLTEKVVWEALLEKMPMTAMLRNLPTMTRVGLLKPMSNAVSHVIAALGNIDTLRKARIHPLGILVALTTYSGGYSIRGESTWEPVTRIIDALNDAFYLSFGTVEPTGKRTLLALDVSGSMDGGLIAGLPGITPRVASAAMALVIAATEPQHQIVAFSVPPGATITYANYQTQGDHNMLVPISISPRQRLDDVVKTVRGIPMGGTDCALPMMWAIKNNIQIDTFIVITDNESWAGHIHPIQALNQYRQKTGIPAKLIVVGMTSNNVSIADPNDSGTLDVTGFDTAAPNIMGDFARE